MGRGQPKDVFVVHSKREEYDRRTVDSLAGLLLPAGFSVWGYSDWDWFKVRKEPPTWQDDLMSDGYLLDPVRALEDPTPRRPKQVDRDRLDTVLSHSHAVIFLNPSARGLSDGMKEELWSLRRRPYRRDPTMPTPVLLWCAFEGDNCEPYPVEDMVWRANLRLHVRDGLVDPTSLKNILLVLTALLLEQRVEYVQGQSSRAQGLLSLLFCSADQELSRASQVLTSVMGHNGETYPSLVQHGEALAVLLKRYRAVDLDDNRAGR